MKRAVTKDIWGAARSDGKNLRNSILTFCSESGSETNKESSLHTQLLSYISEDFFGSWYKVTSQGSTLWGHTSKWQSQHLIQISSLVFPSISCAIACSPKPRGAAIACFSLKMGLTFFCLCSDMRNLHSLLILLNYFQHKENSSEYWLMSCQLTNTILRPEIHSLFWSMDNETVVWFLVLLGREGAETWSFLAHLGTQESGPLHSCSGLALISQGRSHSEIFQLLKRSTAKSCFSIKLLGCTGKC